MTGDVIVATQQIEVKGQCAWCLQREMQAFALICPDHITQWRNTVDDMQADIRALCQAVGEFDGARPETPQTVVNICAERARRQMAALQVAKEVLDCIVINGPGDYIVMMANSALAQIHEIERRQPREEGQSGELDRVFL